MSQVVAFPVNPDTMVEMTIDILKPDAKRILTSRKSFIFLTVIKYPMALVFQVVNNNFDLHPLEPPARNEIARVLLSALNARETT
jgi:hypothetical protein